MVIDIAVGVIALVIGIIAGKLLFAKNTQKQVEDAEHQAKKISSRCASHCREPEKGKTAGSQRAVCTTESRTRQRSAGKEPEAE